MVRLFQETKIGHWKLSVGKKTLLVRYPIILGKAICKIAGHTSGYNSESKSYWCPRCEEENKSKKK